MQHARQLPNSILLSLLTSTIPSRQQNTQEKHQRRNLYKNVESMASTTRRDHMGPTKCINPKTTHSSKKFYFPKCYKDNLLTMHSTNSSKFQKITRDNIFGFVMNSQYHSTITFFIIIIFFFLDVGAQSDTTPQDEPQQQDTIPSSYRPSIAIVIGILAIMVSLTLLLFVYAKYCNLTASDFFNLGDEQQGNQARSRSSGIDKAVIDSLPFFQFSALKGSKQGLECVVCLARFDETEVLRLLPKCKHAFHLECIDKWLESHSSCPLCRQRVELEDLTKFTFSTSLRYPRSNPSDLREDHNLELIVCREPDDQVSSLRFSVGSSFRKNPNSDKGKKDELLIPEGADDQQFLHKFKHKIIVSDVVYNNRWSDLNSSDLLSLNSEMLQAVSSERFAGVLEPVLENRSSSSPISREEMDMKRSMGSKISGIKRSGSVSDIPSTSKTNAMNTSSASKFMIPSGKRSMSEITNLSRFVDFGGRNRIKDSCTGENGEKEEKIRKLWLPIARRTVQWFAGREKESQSEDSKPELPNV